MELSELRFFLQDYIPTKHAVIGFDAFIDQLGRKPSGLGCGLISGISDFGERLEHRGNRSGAVMLEEVVESIGGNAANTSMALGKLGAKVTCICAAGFPKVNDVFESLQEKVKLVSYANPGTCLAVELGESKLFFATNGEMNAMTWDEMQNRIGYDCLLSAYDNSDLIGLFNWGEIRSTQLLWNGLLRDIIPKLSYRPRKFFFDFSDISGRNNDELPLLFQTLRAFRNFGEVYVSANHMESKILCKERMVSEGVVDYFIGHGKKSSCLIKHDGTFVLPTRYLSAPKRLTGSGDSFNAGFCYGLLCGLPEENCMSLANATANCLVRTGNQPGKSSLCRELEASESLWEKRDEYIENDNM